MLPGEMFGSAAQEALERSAQASRTRQQLVGVHRRLPQCLGVNAASGSHQGLALLNPSLVLPRVPSGPAPGPGDPSMLRTSVHPQRGQFSPPKPQRGAHK
ncbi:hypothetical protein AMECASPLE_016842 [Ameca splendens]|uniref:Uncharacterized protein n=1 Tax=Ameca splendens TaxID=208324 RepID=A0ABV0ZNY3_9TELE